MGFRMDEKDLLVSGRDISVSSSSDPNYMGQFRSYIFLLRL